MEKPPQVEKEYYVKKMFGDVRNDPYYWFRNRSRPEFKSYLERENQYTQFMMSDSKEFEDDLHKEMKGKMKEEDDGDEIVAERRRPNYYYHQRWSPMGKNAAGFNMGSSFEPGSKPQVKAEDFEGNEIYTISIFDCEECTMETLTNVTNSFEWASEEALVYIAMEKGTLRPYKGLNEGFRQNQGTPQGKATTID